MVVSAFGCFGGLSDYGYGSTAADLAYNKGVELQKQGLHGQAIQDYDKAIQLNPDYALRPVDPDYVLPYFNRGVAYTNLGEYQRAIEDYDKAIQLDPANALTYHNRGIVLEELGRHSLAEKDSNKACELDRSHC